MEVTWDAWVVVVVVVVFVAVVVVDVEVPAWVVGVKVGRLVAGSLEESVRVGTVARDGRSVTWSLTSATA